MNARPHPFTMVFGEVANESFPGLRDDLERAAVDQSDRDAFLLHRGVAQLVRDLEPEGGMGEAVAQLAALVHHAFLYWRHGEWTIRLEHGAARTLLREGRAGSPPPTLPDAWYVQLPRQLVWGQLGDGEPYQPLDGCFVAWASTGLRVLGVFGVHAGRMGFSVAEAAAPRWPGEDPTGDRMRFSPRMDGAESAGLYSLNSAEDLLVLAGRIAAATPAHRSESPGADRREIVLP